MNSVAVKDFFKKQLRGCIYAGIALVVLSASFIVWDRFHITIVSREVFMQEHPLLTGLMAVETKNAPPAVRWYRIRDGFEQVMNGSYVYHFTRSDEAVVVDRYSTSTDHQNIFLINPVKVNKISARQMPGLVSDIIPSSNGLYVAVVGTSTTGTPYICISKRNVAAFNPNCDYIHRFEKTVALGSSIQRVQWSPNRQAELQIQTVSKNGLAWWLYLPTTKKISQAAMSVDQSGEQDYYGSQSRHLTIERVGFFTRITDSKATKNMYLIAPSESEFLPFQKEYLLQRVGKDIFLVDPRSLTATRLASLPSEIHRITVW